MLQLDNNYIGYDSDTLLQEYDVAWVVEEILDSELRAKYIERLAGADISIQIIEELYYNIFIQKINIW